MQLQRQFGVFFMHYAPKHSLTSPSLILYSHTVYFLLLCYHILEAHIALCCTIYFKAWATYFADKSRRGGR